MNLGQFIKEKRIENNLTMEQLGKKIGVSKMTVSRWESGEIRNMKSDKIEKLAAALGIPVISLFDGWDLNGKKIEVEQISPQEFKDEVIQKLNQVTNLTNQEKQMLINNIEFICSDK